MNNDTCNYCYKQFERDSEVFYWHLKIENAKQEKDNLLIENAVLNKQYIHEQQKDKPNG